MNHSQHLDEIDSASHLPEKEKREFKSAVQLCSEQGVENGKW